MTIYLDGELLPEKDAKISVFDHGLLYGDGIFEGIRFYSRRVFRLEDHISRLCDSARAIHMTLPMSREEIIRATCDTCAANGLDDGYIRLVVTRGTGTLGLDPNRCPKPSVFIIVSKIQLYPAEKYETGLKMATCSTRRPAPAALSPLVKSLNYLNNVMAKLESLQCGAEEGLMLNEQGFVAECTGDNIFVVKNGIVSTPPCSDGALRGITRQVVIEICQQLGIPCREETMTRYEIYTADECFLTGTAAEVVPAVELDLRNIGDGKPGPVTGKIIKKFRELIGTTGTPF
jgi:branched-chain amino acid aminotransferase